MRFLLIAILVLASIAAAVGLDVVRANGYLQWDDAQYLYRGIYHARQVSRHSNLFIPRLFYSLSLESPKPPLYTGWIALGARLFGYRAVPVLLFWSTAPVFLALLLLVFFTARRFAGTAAAWLSAVSVLSFPGVLLYGGSLMVETMLAFWILAGIFLATLWCEEPTLKRSVLLGASVGLGLLTKLTFGVFLAPALVYAVVVLVRRRQWARTLKAIAAVAFVAAAVCGFWYFKHLWEAVDFARYASRFSEFAGRVPFSARVTQIVQEVFGWWWAVILPLLLLGAVWRNERPQKGRLETDFRLMALLGAGFALVVISVARYFEARFFMPIAPTLAVTAGAAGASFLRSRGTGVAVAAFALLAGGLVLSVRRYGAREPAPAISGMTKLLDELHGEFGRTFRLGLVGSDATFNLYRVELASILRPTYSDVTFVPLGDRGDGGDPVSFQDVDAVLAFAKCPEPSTATSSYVNRNCSTLRTALQSRTSNEQRRTVTVSDSSRPLEIFDLRARLSGGQPRELNRE